MMMMLWAQSVQTLFVFIHRNGRKKYNNIKKNEVTKEKTSNLTKQIS